MTLHPTRFLIAAACALFISGCASQKGQPTTQFDFGPAVDTAAVDTAAVDTAAVDTAAVNTTASVTTTATPAAGAPGAVVVTDVTGNSAYDSERMIYRLSYADPLQARAYANSRWTASPLQMLTQRFKVRLAQSGAKVLSETDAAAGIPLLRIEVDDFIHDFSGAAQSQGVVAVRASLFRGHTLVDQKSFRRTTAAASADAAGGARALAASTDAVAADLAAWLATVNTQGR